MKTLALALALFTALGLAAPAQAIPAFARRYKTACTACHVLPPKLNPAGLAFRNNGYRWPNGERGRQERDVQLGAPEWEEVWPSAFLPGTVSDVPPFAGMVYAAVAADRGGKVSTEETSLFADLLTAGNLGKRFSWFAAVGAGTGFAGVERLWASFDQILGNWLGARAGYLEPGVVPFSRYTHKLSYLGYLPFEAQGPAGVALSSSHLGLEAFGSGIDPGPLRGLQYVVGLAARQAVGGLAADGYARVSYKFGGVAAGGDKTGEPGRLSPVVAPLDEESFRVGAFVYKATLNGPDSRPRAWRSGFDAELLAGRFDAFGTALAGGDSSAASAPESSSWSLMCGAGARFYPWLLTMARYEAGWMAGSGAQRRMVGTVRAALQQNVAVSVDVMVEMPDADHTETSGSVFLAF